jgi:hypothetical protein
LNTARRGNTKEVRTAEWLEADGWTVGSRRHIAGPGDLLAIKDGERPRLIEVKAGRGSPYENFRRPDRMELREFAFWRGLVPELAWWPLRAREPQFIDETAWPESGLLDDVA